MLLLLLLLLLLYVLYLQFTLHVLLFPVLNVLYFYVSTQQRMCAVPSMAVFCSSLISCCLSRCSCILWMILKWCQLPHIITGITFVFTFHVCFISVVRSLYFRIYSSSFLITVLSPENVTSINLHIPFSLSRIMISGLLVGMFLSVCTCWFHNMVTLSSGLVSAYFGTLLLLLLL